MLKEIDIRAVCPSLTLDCFQLGARRSKVQSHQQLADLMMLESVQRGHHEVYQPTIAVARYEQDRILHLGVDCASEAGGRPIRWRLSIEIGLKAKADGKNNDRIDA